MDPLNQDNLKKFVAAWYFALDIHAPAEDCHKYLASEGLQMAFPEKTLASYDDFDQWLSGIYRTFFDENHVVQSVAVTGSAAGGGTNVNVVVAWQASWFTPPEPKSRRTCMNAIQRWVIRPSDKNAYGLEIVEYYVDRFDYAPGFAQL